MWKLCALLIVICQLVASEVSAAETGRSFDTILKTAIRGTFDQITEYVRANPEAADSERAWRWLFSTSLEAGLEVDAIDLATEYQKRPQPDATTRALAQQAQILGQAMSGKTDDAVQNFSGMLRFARLQTGGALIDFGRRLATKLRMSGDIEASRVVYEQIANKFFLNADVRHTCENHIARLELVNKLAPEFGVPDTANESVDLAALQGKVVLLDFWATNCPPCIEELPNIIQLHRDFRDRGFEVIGISLDGDDSLVASFTQRAGMSWRQIVDPTDVQKLRDLYMVETIPSLYVLDREGNVAQFDVKGGDLRQTIEKLLGK